MKSHYFNIPMNISAFLCLWQGVFFIGLIMALSGNILAQAESSDSKLIVEGLQEATSIYATQNHLYVVESGKNRVLKMDHDGKLLETVGGLGTGNYQFDTPIDVDATNGLKIYISDSRNNRIQIYDRRFQYLSSITGKESFGQGIRIVPTQIVVNTFGELLAYDASSRSVLKFNENGSFTYRFDLPSGIREVSEMRLNGEDLEITDHKAGVVQLITQNGLPGASFPFNPGDFVDEVILDGVIFKLYQDKIVKYLDSK